MPDRPLSRWALVTGGSRGIGAETARALARRGYDIVITYRSRLQAAESVVAELTSLDRRAEAVALDVSDLDACASVAAELVDRHGAPRAVVHSAGQVLRASVEDTDTESLLQLFATNVFGAFVIDRELARAMRAAGGGSLTHVASVIGPGGMRGRSAYAATKSALLGLTAALAAELAPTIRVNCVLPGLFRTEMNQGLLQDPEQQAAVHQRIPLNRLGDAAECASAIAFLASDDSSYITGACLAVDGGVLSRLSFPGAD